MPIGILNPGDLARTTSTRPAAVLTAINQRRWFSDALATEIRDQDLNAILGQLRYVFDFYAIPDVEGDEAMLQKAIAAGSTALAGNLLALQNLTGAADKIPYFTSPTGMSTFTASSYSRGLLGKTSLLQWQDALGISAAASMNVIALGGLAGGADQLPYFTGTGTMSQTTFTSFSRQLLDDTTATAMRTTLGLGTMATATASAYAALAGATFTGDITAPRLVVDGGDIVVNRDTDASPARLYLIANTGFAATVEFKADFLSANRWVLGKNSDAESTGDVGSNFHLWAYTDAGASLGRVFRVIRSTKVLGFDQIPTAPTATVGDDSTQLATTAFVTAAVGGGGSFQPLDPDLTAIAGLATAADRLPYFTGPGAAALATFTAFARTLLDDADAATARTTLGVPLGTSGATVPLLSTANTWTLGQTFTAGITSNGATTFGHTSGIQVTAGSIHVNRTLDAADATVQTSGDSGYRSVFIAGKGGYWRWLIGKNTDAESGGNTGGNFYIESWNDDSSLSLGVALTINRISLIAAFAVSPTAPTPAAADSSLKLATTAFVQGELAGHQPLDATLTAFAGVVGAADKFPYFTAADAFSTATITAAARTVLDDTTVAAMLTTMGGAPLASPAFTGNPTAVTQAALNNSTRLATTAYVEAAVTAGAGSGGQPLDATLTALSGLTTAADAVPYFTGTDVASTMTVTSVARAVLDDTSYAAMLATMGGAPLASPAFTGSPTVGGVAVSTVSLAAANAWTGVQTFANGTVALPGLTFSGETDCGIRIAGTNALSLVVNATDTLNIQPAVVQNNASIFRTGKAGANSSIQIRGDAGFGRDIIGQTSADLKRWYLQLGDATAEGGSNAGSNFTLFRYDDAGAVLGGAALLTIYRSSGGMVYGAASGGDKGAGSINAVALYEGGVALSAKYGQLGVANTLTAQQTMSLATASAVPLILLSTDAGALLGPILDLYRNSASAADSDILGGVYFSGNSDTLVKRTYASIEATAVDTGNASEDGNLLLRAVSGGTLTTLATIGVSTNGIATTTFAGGTGSGLTFRLMPASGIPFLQLVASASGTAAIIQGLKGSAGPRWAVQLGDATVEAGSDVGSDFKIIGYGDGGATTGDALTIYRKTSAVVLNGAAGGDKGAGTLNAAGLFVNGVAVSAGSGASTGAANIFTAQQTMTLATASAIPLALVSTDAGALAGPILELYRDSASPAAADIIGAIRFAARDSAAAKIAEAASIEAVNSVVTTGSAYRTTLAFKVNHIGGLTQQMIIAGGIVCGTSGVHQGEGTLNTRLAAGLYEAGVAISAKYEPLGKLVAVDVKTANYTLVLADIGKLIEMNVASANTLTVPPNSTVAFAIGTRIDIAQYGAGQTTITPGAGVTIRSSGTKLKLTGLYAVASLYKRATDEWVAMGDLSA